MSGAALVDWLSLLKVAVAGFGAIVVVAAFGLAVVGAARWREARDVGRAGIGDAGLVILGLTVCTGAVTLGMVALVTG
jgi:hypothetical protein